jgi:catechol 2,3-dioxygenase-like lactoylglutathione lyase family enzyme
MGAVVNHIGLAVTDLARSRRFYEEVLGFTYRNEVKPHDAATAKLLAIEAPVGLTAVYLERDGWVLELLSYERDGNPPRRDRPMNEPGLTHISVSVDDVDATCASAVEFGGEVLHDRGFRGMVEMIRDPDGQLIEVLPMTYRDNV